jgi:peptidoglycan/xylan/chitin deacetylase (PgdA/CDA1 family)
VSVRIVVLPASPERTRACLDALAADAPGADVVVAGADMPATDAALLLVVPAAALPQAGFVASHLRAHEAGDAVALGRVEGACGDSAPLSLSAPRVRVEAAGGLDASDEHAVLDLAARLVEAGIRRVEVDARAVLDPPATPADALADGRRAVALYRERPRLLPLLVLGGREELPRNARVLLGLALALRVPPSLAARALPHELALAHGYWHGVRSAADRDLWSRLRRGTLILLYHGVGGPDEPASRFVVPAERLARQLRWLRRTPFTPLALDEYLRCRAEHRLPPPRSVVLTFDDGYVDNDALARPLLEEHGIPATMFVVSDGGGANRWSRPGATLAGRPLLGVAVKDRQGGAFAYGAHTRTHPRLADIDIAQAETEIAGSKAELEQALGTPVELFAYPHGNFDPAVRDAVVRSGFGLACGVDPGRNRPATDPFALRRVEIYGTYGIVRFLLSLWLGDVRLRRDRGDV